MKIIIVSVPGGGKSTVLKFVKKKLPRAKFVTAGDIYFKIVGKKYGIKDRDEMRKKLTIEQQKEIQVMVAEKISKIRAKILFINTHIMVKTPRGYFQALSIKTMGIMKPDAIAIIESNPKDVLERRMTDKTRKRDIESLWAIEEHQRINRKVAFELTKNTNCRVKIINLRFREKKQFDQARKGADEIVKLIEAMR